MPKNGLQKLIEAIHILSSAEQKPFVVTAMNLKKLLRIIGCRQQITAMPNWNNFIVHAVNDQNRA